MPIETGPVNQRLSSLSGEGGDYASEKRRLTAARVVLGALKEQLRLGGVNVGAIRRVLDDGTEIIARTILGAGGMADVDNVYINRPVPVAAPPVVPLPTEEFDSFSQSGARLLALFLHDVYPDATTSIVAIDIETYAQTLLYQFTENSDAALAFYSIAAGANSYCLGGYWSGVARFFDREWNERTRFTAPGLGYPNEILTCCAYLDGFFYIGSRNIQDWPSPPPMNHIYVFDETGALRGTIDTEAYEREVYGDNYHDGLNVDTDAERDDDGNLVTSSLFDNFRKSYESTLHERSLPTLAPVRSLSVVFTTGSGLPTSAAGLAVSADSFYTMESGSTYAAAPQRLYKLSRASGQVVASYVLPGVEAGFHETGNPIAWFGGKLFVSRTGSGTIYVFDENLALLDRIILDAGISDPNQNIPLGLTIDLYDPAPLSATWRKS